MTFSPSPFLVRLQELKLWQGNYDNLLQNKKKETDCDCMDGISPLYPKNCSEKVVDWDQKVVSPSKPFEELLEEKLATDKPIEVKPKPKKPFLRKGEGLARFKLKSAPISNKSSLTSKKSSTRVKSNDCISKKHEEKLRNEVFLPAKKLDPKMLSPLKIPDSIIQSKGIWLDAAKGDQEYLKKPQISPKKLKNDREKLRKTANTFNSEIINKIHEYGQLQHFLPRNKKEVISSTENLSNKASSGPGEQTLYEQQLEKELRIFEMLEQKAENSSFSSTNTSVINLLSSSTPNKNKKVVISEAIQEEKVVKEIEKNSKECTPEKKSNCLNFQQKLMQINEKNDLLRNFLVNLKRTNKRKSSVSSDSETSDFTPICSLNATFSDDEKWSSTVTSPTKSQSSYYTEHTIHSSVQKIETAVNTSFVESNVTIKDDKCENCESLENKLKELSKNVPNVQAEKAKVMDFVKDLEHKRDELNNELKRISKVHEEEIKKIRADFDSERKRFAKEKVYFETYVKDAQNRPSRKDREEIQYLKKELADIKELVKLKETKNGATLCRLRNQIKLLEKENGELKNELDKLRKENSKLLANQKINRRPTDTKMLQEINRNLSKLTEETFKKQQNKSSRDSEDEKVKNTKVESKKVSENLLPKENIEPKVVTTFKNSITRTRESSGSNDSSSFDLPDISIEKQYESVFGHFESPRANNNNTTNSEKTETVFEDGSMLIKYSNGNEKTVSPDGTTIKIKYFNGDIKETNTKTKTIGYFYLENNTWHTQYEDGSEIIEYPDGQRSKKHKDGKIEVNYSDGTYRVINSDGSEEARYPDGSKTFVKTDGEVTIFLPNGQKEIHTKTHKRREYPDGTVRILYEDGRIETRYSNGRIRIKDANNVLIMDTHQDVM